MEAFPTLSEMGINRFEEITHYALRQDGKAKDVLRISYKRKKGSVLPERKTFKFGRSAKMISDHSAANGSVEVFEISPFLQRAITELNTIVSHRNSSVDKVKQIRKRVDQLEADVKFATTEIRSLLDDLKE